MQILVRYFEPRNCGVRSLVADLRKTEGAAMSLSGHRFTLRGVVLLLLPGKADIQRTSEIGRS
jgi:hypothetical protein